MPNPRQRRKVKNGSRGGKPTQNGLRRLHNRSNRAPSMKGPLALQENWDKHKTVRQNYEALGLLTSIPLSSNLNPLPAKASTKQLSENLISGYGRIVRDEDGNVVDVILPEDEEGASNSNEAEEDSDVEEEQRTVQGKTEVVKTLETLSSTTNIPIKRHSSLSEKEWLTNLVEKYGADTALMSRDRGLNVWQKTSGEIGRMIRKAGGVQKLQERVKVRGGTMMVE